MDAAPHLTIRVKWHIWDPIRRPATANLVDKRSFGFTRCPLVSSRAAATLTVIDRQYRDALQIGTVSLPESCAAIRTLEFIENVAGNVKGRNTSSALLRKACRCCGCLPIRRPSEATYWRFEFATTIISDHGNITKHDVGTATRTSQKIAPDRVLDGRPSMATVTDSAV